MPVIAPTPFPFPVPVTRPSPAAAITMSPPSPASPLAALVAARRPAAGRDARPTTPPAGVKRRATRSCGPCNACCVAPSIPELDKPVDTPCPHLKQGPKGCCSVYDDRPAVCQKFLCAWRLGLGEQIDRPDLLGVMVQPTQKADGQTLLAFVEIRPKALDSRRARELMVRWAAASGEGVTVRRAQSRHFISIPVTVERREVKAAGCKAG